MLREPLTDLQIDALEELLFRPTLVSPAACAFYALLDGARDRRLHDAMRDAGLPITCLFSGRLTPAMASAAPYLVQLRRGSPFVRFILQHGWGNAWGIFAVSTATHEEMRRHFRRFLRVVDENGKKLFFRYYDPRVFRIYLPTCTEEELATVFGPVRRFCFEAEDPRWLIEHALKDGRLLTAELDALGDPSPQ